MATPRRRTKIGQDFVPKMVRVPRDVDARIVALAKKRGLSMNALIIELVRKGLDALEAEEPPMPLAQAS